jgi:hypothetical protein
LKTGRNTEHQQIVNRAGLRPPIYAALAGQFHFGPANTDQLALLSSLRLAFVRALTIDPQKY